MGDFIPMDEVIQYPRRFEKYDYVKSFGYETQQILY